MSAPEKFAITDRIAGIGTLITPEKDGPQVLVIAPSSDALASVLVHAWPDMDWSREKFRKLEVFPK